MVMYYFDDIIIQSSYYISTVSSNPSNAILETEILREPDNHYGYGEDLDEGNTAELLLYLQQRFGPVSSFSGSYRADRWEINIHRTTSTYCKTILILDPNCFVLAWK